MDKFISLSSYASKGFRTFRVQPTLRIQLFTNQNTVPITFRVQPTL